MTYTEAITILLRDTQDDGGTFTRLRLGEDPGSEKIHGLRLALRTLWREIAGRGTIPQDVAFACGVVIRFRDECVRNVADGAQRDQRTIRALQLAVDDLAQGAFDVLAGDEAKTWMVPRPDLDDGDAEKGNE